MSSRVLLRPARFDATPAQSIRRNLIAYYPFDVQPAKSAMFDAGGPYDLTDHGTIVSGVGPSANLPTGAQFNSVSSQYYSGSNWASFSPGNAPFCVAGWFYITAYTKTFPTVIGKWNTTGNQREWIWPIDTASTTIFAIFDQLGTFVTLSSPNLGVMTTGAWHHYVFWIDAGATRYSYMRKDMATPVKSSLAITTVFKGTGTLIVGQDGALSVNDYLDGRVAHIGVWNRVLSEAEQAWLYNNGAGRDLRRSA